MPYPTKIDLGTETDFYQHIKNTLEDKVRFERIENTVLPGIPDTNAHRNGDIVPVEFKLADGGTLWLETFQNAYFTKAASEGSRAKIIAKTPHQVLVWNCKGYLELLAYGNIKVRGMGTKSPAYGLYSRHTRLTNLFRTASFASEPDKAPDAEALAEALFA